MADGERYVVKCRARKHFYRVCVCVWSLGKERGVDVVFSVGAEGKLLIFLCLRSLMRVCVSGMRMELVPGHAWRAGLSSPSGCWCSAVVKHLLSVHKAGTLILSTAMRKSMAFMKAETGCLFLGMWPSVRRQADWFLTLVLSFSSFLFRSPFLSWQGQSGTWDVGCCTSEDQVPGKPCFPSFFSFLFCE